MSVYPMTSRISMSYNSVSWAYRPLSFLLRLFGVFPLGEKRANCVQLLSITLNAVLVLTTLGISVKYDFLDSAITMDESTSVIILWAICLGSLSTLFAAPFKGAQHTRLFSKWRQIDQKLSVEVDEAISRTGRRFTLLFVLLVTLFMATSVTIVFSQRSSEDPVTNLVLSLQVLLLTWNYGAVALVQTCVYYFCVAIKMRFEVLGLRVRQTLALERKKKRVHVFTLNEEEEEVGGEVDIARELEELRHDYHLLTEISLDTSAHFSPHILLSFLLDSAILCTSMYRVIKASHLAIWCFPLEMLTMLVAILKILAINIVGDDVASAVTSLDALVLIHAALEFDKTPYTFIS